MKTDRRSGSAPVLLQSVAAASKRRRRESSKQKPRLSVGGPPRRRWGSVPDPEREPARRNLALHLQPHLLQQQAKEPLPGREWGWRDFWALNEEGRLETNGLARFLASPRAV
ncbi:hypothetical protein MTO96_005808 [Rhipicephalus appendiculatus]